MQNVIIRGEKWTFDLRGWLASRATEEFEIADVTGAALWHGVERATGARRVARLHYLETILALLPVLPYTEPTAYEHARIWAKLGTAGKMIGYYDLIVAATAMERGSDVATFNKSHFGLVNGLKVIEPK